VSASTGVTTSDFDYTTPDEVIRDADLAMYRAKATRAGSAMLFDESLRIDGLTLSTAPCHRR
jgi:predicted signal transduction protein with EAL and GGDEF domain